MSVAGRVAARRLAVARALCRVAAAVVVAAAAVPQV